MVAGLAGCGGTGSTADGASTERSLANILTQGQGVWYQRAFGDGTTVGPGIPANRTEASWRFMRQSGLRDGLDGIGTRLTRLVLPNGSTGRWSTPGLGTSFSWRLEGTRLVTLFQGFSLSTREEVGTLTYDPATDEIAVQSDVWGTGRWVRWERAFAENPDFGGGTQTPVFTTVSGPRNAFSVEIPATWSDVRREQGQGFSLLTATPPGAVIGQPATPGVAIYLFPESGLDPASTLGQMAVGIRNCFQTGDQPVTNAAGLSGRLHRFDGCGGTSAGRINFALSPPDNRLLLVGSVWTRTVTDGTAAQRILDSLRLTT